MKKNNQKSLLVKLSLLTLTLASIGGSLSSSNADNQLVEVSAWSGNQTPNIGTYYASITPDMSGDTLKSALKKIVSSPFSPSYDWSRYEALDEVEGDSSKVLLIYSRINELKTNHVSGSTGWNREHTFPQSKMSSPATTDNHIIFADDNKTNSSRGNKEFADLKKTGTRVKDGYGNLTDNYTNSTYFEPNDEAKPEVAWATLYANVKYGYSITNNFDKIETALEWSLKFPVTNHHIYRNNKAQELQKNRNPFVDYPAYACKIWGDTNSNTKNICNKYMQEDQKLVVTPSSSEVNINDTVKLEVAYKGGLAEGVAYESSNPLVASVSPAGIVTAHQVGSVTITVTSLINSSIKAKVTINIAEAPVIEPPSSEVPSSEIPSSEVPSSEANPEVVIETTYYTFTDIEGNVTTDDEDTTKWNITSTNKPTKMGKNGIVLEEEQDKILFTTSRTYEKIEAFDLIYSTDNNVGKGQANLYALNNIDDQISGETLIGSVELPSTDGETLKTVGIALNPLAEALLGKYLAVEIEVEEGPIYFIGTHITEKKHANEGIITPPQPSKNHTGLIIGLSIGGVLLIGGTIFLIIYLRKRRAIN